MFTKINRGLGDKETKEFKNTHLRSWIARIEGPPPPLSLFSFTSYTSSSEQFADQKSICSECSSWNLNENVVRIIIGAMDKGCVRRRLWLIVILPTDLS